MARKERKAATIDRRERASIKEFLAEIGEIGELDTGDVCWESGTHGRVIVENKTTLELIGDFHTERVKSQIRRMRIECDTPVLVIGGVLQEARDGTCLTDPQQLFVRRHGKDPGGIGNYKEISGFLLSLMLSGVLVSRVDLFRYSSESLAQYQLRLDCAISAHIVHLYKVYFEKLRHSSLDPSKVMLSSIGISSRPSYVGGMLTVLPGIGEVVADSLLGKEKDIVKVLDGLRDGSITPIGMTTKNADKIKDILKEGS